MPATTVGVTPTKIGPDQGRGQAVLVHNASAAAVYLGPANVTTTTGFPIAAGATLNVNSNILYGIVATGTADVRWMIARTT